MATTQLVNKEDTTASMLDTNSLKSHSRWIRDTLDPLIARDGAESISVEDALYLDQFLRQLLLASISVQDIRSTRIHKALIEIAERSTRWPHRLIERAEGVIQVWEVKHGRLAEIGIDLLGPGGRLDGIATMASLAADNLLMTWLKQGDKVSPARARKQGDLDFVPGSWWINPMFAFRAGIIDSGDPNGGIIADEHGAYAVLLTGTDEIASISAEAMTYRSHLQDRGRYRLTSAVRDSRRPVRILRSHTLHSLWSPRVGVRYDGLYRVVGWSIHYDAQVKATVYDIKFLRLTTEPQMEAVLHRPYADEVEDFAEFTRLRLLAATTHAKASKPVRKGNL